MLNNNDYLTIFHEIKNSITLISSSLQLLEKKYPEVQKYDYWKESMQEINFLKKVVTELSASRTANSIEFTKVSVSDFLTDISDSIHSLSSENFFCEMSIDDTLPDIEMDPIRLRQAIINLLKNSYEAMNHSGTVLLNVSLEQNYVCFDIVDSGGGISADYEDKIFSPLITSKPYGSGLGLPITKKIVEAHNGTISFVSRPGDGCTFTIRLPIHQS